MGRALDGFRLASLAVVERYAVDIVPDFQFPRIVGIGGHRRPRHVRVLGLRPDEIDVFAVLAPRPVALDVGRIVRAAEREHLAGLLRPDAQDSHRREEHLQELVAGIIPHEQGLVHRADHVPAVRRHPGQEPEDLVVFRPFPVLEIAPREDVLRVDLQRLLHRRHRVHSLVAARPVHVHAHGGTVGGEAVAVRAGRHVFQEKMRLRLRHIPDLPFNERNTRHRSAHAGGLSRVEQRNAARKNRRPDRVFGRPNRHLALRQHIQTWALGVGCWTLDVDSPNPPNLHHRLLPHRLLLHQLPHVFFRSPSLRRGLVTRFVVDIYAAFLGAGRVERERIGPTPGNEHVDRVGGSGEGDLEQPGVRFCLVVPQERRGHDVRRKERFVFRVVDRDRLEILRRVFEQGADGQARGDGREDLPQARVDDEHIAVESRRHTSPPRRRQLLRATSNHLQQHNRQHDDGNENDKNDKSSFHRSRILP